MADMDLDEKELAAGAAVAMQVARDDRREQKLLEAQSRASTGSVALSIIFVAVSSIGTLVLMLVFGN